MKIIFNKLNLKVLILLGLFFLIILSSAIYVVAIGTYTEGYRINTGTTQNIIIDSSGTCKKVTNNNGNNLFIPIITTAEWNAFIANKPAGVTIEACCTPSCAGKCGGASDGCSGTCTSSCPSGSSCVGTICVAGACLLPNGRYVYNGQTISGRYDTYYDNWAQASVTCTNGAWFYSGSYNARDPGGYGWSKSCLTSNPLVYHFSTDNTGGHCHGMGLCSDGTLTITTGTYFCYNDGRNHCISLSCPNGWAAKIDVPACLSGLPCSIAPQICGYPFCVSASAGQLIPQ